MSNFKIGEKVVFIGGEVIMKETLQPKINEIVEIIGFSKIRKGNLYIKGYTKNLEDYNQSFRPSNFRKLDYEFAENLLAEITEAMKIETILN